MYQEELIGLDEKEYLFLSEKFDVMTADDTKQLPRYIVSGRKSNLRRLVQIAMENELDKTAQSYIRDKFFNELTVTDIAKKYSVSRQAVYRVLGRAQKRLFDVLKYAYYCGFSLLEPPKDFEEIIARAEMFPDFKAEDIQ